MARSGLMGKPVMWLAVIVAALALVATGCSDGASKEDVAQAVKSAIAAQPTPTPMPPGITLDQIKSAVADEVKKNLPTPVPTPKPLTEAEIRKIAQEEALKVASELNNNLTYKQVQDLIKKAVDDAAAKYKDKSATDVDIKAFVKVALTGGKDIESLTATATATTDNKYQATGKLPALPNDISHDGWTIKLTDAAVDIGDKNGDGWPDNDGMVGRWLARLKAPAPAKWETAPNVPNTKVPDFDVKAGLEYTGDWNTPFCQQDMRCDFIVPAGEFRYVAGEYGFLDVNNCSGEKGVAFQLWLVNIGGESTNFRNQCADNGGTRHGRFWDSSRLDQGLWGGVSHETAGMFGMKTIFNADNGEVGNAGGSHDSVAGANCGTMFPSCQYVDIFIVVHAGDRIVATAHTRVMRQ